MEVGASAAPVSDAVEGVIGQHVLYKRNIFNGGQSEQSVNRTLLMMVLSLFHLGFRVEDGESLLADGYPHNIWETWF